MAGHGITAQRYRQLLAANFPDGCVPCALPPPKPRIAKRPRSFACEHCAFATTTASLLRRHESDRHDIGVVWHACSLPLPDGTPCTYRGKNRDDVTEHWRKCHGIGVRWHACDQPGCTFRTKTANALKKHKANKHDIDVVWHACPVPGCSFVCKQRGNLLQHAKWMHSGRPIVHLERLRRNMSSDSDDDEDDDVRCKAVLADARRVIDDVGPRPQSPRSICLECTEEDESDDDVWQPPPALED